MIKRSFYITDYFEHISLNLVERKDKVFYFNNNLDEVLFSDHRPTLGKRKVIKAVQEMLKETCSTNKGINLNTLTTLYILNKVKDNKEGAIFLPKFMDNSLAYAEELVNHLAKDVAFYSYYCSECKKNTVVAIPFDKSEFEGLVSFGLDLYTYENILFERENILFERYVNCCSKCGCVHNNKVYPITFIHGFFLDYEDDTKVSVTNKYITYGFSHKKCAIYPVIKRIRVTYMKTTDKIYVTNDIGLRHLITYLDPMVTISQNPLVNYTLISKLLNKVERYKGVSITPCRPEVLNLKYYTDGFNLDVFKDVNEIRGLAKLYNKALDRLISLIGYNDNFIKYKREGVPCHLIREYEKYILDPKSYSINTTKSVRKAIGHDAYRFFAFATLCKYVKDTNNQLKIINSYLGQKANTYLFKDKRMIKVNKQLINLFGSENNFANRISDTDRTENMRSFIDTLNMSLEVVKQKQPLEDSQLIGKRNVKNIHDFVMGIYRKLYIKNIEIPHTKNEKARECSVDNYEIKLAKNTHELSDIGDEMSICVGSYGQACLDKKCTIYYLRDTNKNSYVGCIEVKGNNVVQAKGKYNCRLQDEHYEVVMNWIQENKLIIDTIDLRVYKPDKIVFEDLY